MLGSKFDHRTKYLVLHRLRVYQFEKQKGHLIVPEEERPAIKYPDSDVSERLRKWHKSISA